MILRALRPPATATAALSLCAALTLWASPGWGQEPPPCMDWKQLTDFLEKEHGEVAVGVGIDISGTRMLEVYASPSGSFTVLVTIAGGPACLVASGQGWQTIQPKKKQGPEL